MGVDGLKKYISEALAVYAARKGLSALPQYADVHIEDVASRVFRCASRDSGLKGFLRNLAEPLRHAIAMGTRLAIIAFDNPRYPVPTKQQERADRRSKEPGESYEGARIDLDTVTLQDAASGREIKFVYGPKLVATKNLGVSMGQCLVAYLRNMSEQDRVRWHPDTTLIVDLEPELFVWQPHNKNPKPFGIPLDDLKGDPVCEGEIKAIRWITRLRPSSATSYFVNTIDSDALALLVYHTWNVVQSPNAPLYHWSTYDKEQTSLFNINELTTKILRSNFDRAQVWLLWCILLGTDHFKRRRDVLGGANNNELRIVLRKGLSIDGISSPRLFDEFLRTYYTKAISSSVEDAPAPWSWRKLQSSTSKTLPASWEQQKLAYGQLVEAIYYWDTLTTREPLPLPVPEPVPVPRPIAAPAPVPAPPRRDIVDLSGVAEMDAVPTLESKDQAEEADLFAGAWGVDNSVAEKQIKQMQRGVESTIAFTPKATKRPSVVASPLFGRRSHQ